MKSKRKLFEALDQYFGSQHFRKEGLNSRYIRNETYGQKSCIYIHAGSSGKRKQLEQYLIEQGFKVNENYCQDLPKIEVQVSHFSLTSPSQ